MASFDISRTLLFYFFLSFLYLNSEAAVFLYNNCDPSTDTYTQNSTYERNLNSLLSSFQSNSKQESGFYNLSVGQDPPDIVYGLFLCRGDVTEETCQECVAKAAEHIVAVCSNQKTAIVFFEECTLRYSNHSFFHNWQREPKLRMLNTNVSQPDSGPFMLLIVNMMTDILIRAANDRSGKKYATGEANFATFQTLNTLAQCTPDLNVSSCLSCLQTALVSFPSCCLVKEEGRIFFPSCMLIYELHPLNRNTTVPPSPTTPVLPSLPAPQSKEEKTQNKSILIPLGASLSATLGLALFSTCVFFFIWRKRNIKEDKIDSQEVQLLNLVVGRVPNGNSSENFNLENVGKSQEFPSIQLDILNAATNHFCDENKLGQGGFGPVYKGTLSNGKEIAVKRLSRTSGQGLHEFKNEVMLIARLQHKNLVRLLGCCLEKNEKLLVYEFMPNRSLDKFLFDSRLAMQLPWQKRFSIIKGIARGIMYLHEDSRLKIIHRDLKASNVLLDHEMSPKISDFGMAKIFSGDQNEANTNKVVGTYGYMAPEYAMEGLFSIKSDVFSFGVLLLEIISGKRNNGFHLLEPGESLLTFAWRLWSKSEGMVLIDDHLVESCLGDEVLKCIQIGLLCVQEDPIDRPTMSTVVVMLANDNTITLPLPTKPAFSVGRSVAARPIQPTSNDRICSVNEITISNLSPR